MTVYSFHQNNSGGYFIEPAKNILVKNARDEAHATELAEDAGMYLDDGSDCSCCGDRWGGCDYEHETMEEAKDFAIKSSFGRDQIPAYVVVDGGHILPDIAVAVGDRL